MWGLATSWALWWGALLSEICRAASWWTLTTSIRHERGSRHLIRWTCAGLSATKHGLTYHDSGTTGLTRKDPGLEWCIFFFQSYLCNLAGWVEGGLPPVYSLRFLCVVSYRVPVHGTATYGICRQERLSWHHRERKVTCVTQVEWRDYLPSSMHAWCLYIHVLPISAWPPQESCLEEYQSQSPPWGSAPIHMEYVGGEIDSYAFNHPFCLRAIQCQGWLCCFLPKSLENYIM